MNDKNQLSALDQFALAALAGGLGQGDLHESGIGFAWDAEVIADRAYSIALAMRDISRTGVHNRQDAFTDAVLDAQKRAESMLRSSTKKNSVQMARPQTSSAVVMTIPEFCDQQRFSKAFLYKLIAEGRGPRLMKVGRRTLITGESASNWRENQMQNK